MKVLRLDLAAYGPFTDATIDLSGGDHGLHIVYGPNEAGKTTALRALRHLLYGIPERSPDAFRHPFPKLRIGGALRAADGRTLDVVRRKGRAGTLRRAADESVVPDAELQRFLNGVDAGFFATMFGIGYEDLVAGGTEVVRGGGDLGRLLFAAGSGSAPLGRVLDQLNAEADALFRPAGQKQRINAAVAELKQRRAELAAVQLMGAEWARHDRELSAALAAKAATEGDLQSAQRRLSRLKRIAEAHPVMAARRETLKALQPVADAVLLPEGFADRRGPAFTRLQVAESERDQARSALANLRAALTELGEPEPVLGYAERVEDAYQDLGSQRKAARDRIGLETRRSALRSEARQILRSLREDLTLEESERLRIRRTEAVRINELGAEYERIVGRIESSRSRAPDLERQAGRVAAALDAAPAPRPVGELRQRVAAAEPALAVERQLPTARAEAETQLDGCADAVAKLGLAVPELRELARLPVPADETVQVFQDRFDRLEHRSAAAAEEARRVEERLGEIERRLEESRLQQEVPTEADLQAARRARDDGWREIRARLQGAPADPAQAGALAEGFEAALRSADALSDRLRREADRVAEKARLLADRSGLHPRRAALREELAAVQAELRATAAEWGARWQDVPVRPGSPREMRRWLAQFSLVLAQAAHALERRSRCAHMEAEVAAARRAVGEGLAALGEAPEAGEALSELVRRAREIVASEDEAARGRDELERERARLRVEIAAAEARRQSDESDFRRWQKDWAQAVKPLGLGAEARPAEAGAVIEELKRLFDHLKDAEVLQQRLDGIERDAEAFGRNVSLLAAEVARDLDRTSAEQAALELQRRLTAAREAQSRRAALGRQIEEAEERLRNTMAAIAEAHAALNAMCAEAGCTTVAGLPLAERRSDDRRLLEARLGRETERLLQLGGGSAVEDFVREASAVDPDGIGGEIGRLQDEIRELTIRKSELDQQIGSERAELNRMDGSDRAARIAEDIQAILGGMGRDVEHYARIRIASRVLTTAIERFRERSQGPILGRASALFRQLTCGSFDRLRAELGADGQPVIAGVRPGGGEAVAVDGMSDGTADQLFLALRLAGLEHYLDANEAMPFVVDDILITFDDERAAAALQALSALSARTQVIFFTHHRHLLELAAGVLDPAAVFAHSLPPAAAPPGQRPLRM